MKELPPAAGMRATSRRPAPMLIGLIGAPVAASLAFMGNFAISHESCTLAGLAARLALLGFAAAVAGYGGYAARIEWRRAGASPDFPTGATAARDRFLTIAAMTAAAASLLLTLYLTAVVLFLDPCWLR